MRGFRICLFWKGKRIMEGVRAIQSRFVGFHCGALKIYLIILRLFEANVASNDSYLVHFHSKIIMKLHFVSWDCLEAFSHRPDFAAKPRLYKLWPLVSKQLWGQGNNIGCKLMVIGHANLHKEDYDLKFVCTWLWLDFVSASAKFARSWLDCLDAFCDHLTLLKWAYSESSQNFEKVESFLARFML